MKTALFLTDYDLSTVHYLCSYYMDNANLDRQDEDYITELQNRVETVSYTHLTLPTIMPV